MKTALVAAVAASKMASGMAASRHAAAAEQAAHNGHIKAPAGHLTDEVVDQLKKLADLRDAGVLTEREFAANKSKLLPALKK